MHYDHRFIMTLVIGYTCVGVFVTTSIATTLSLLRLVDIDSSVRKRLYQILLLEVVSIALSVWSGFLALDPKPLKEHIEHLETSNQTLEALSDKPLVPAAPTPIEYLNFSSITVPIQAEDLSASLPQAQLYFHIVQEAQRGPAELLAFEMRERFGVSVPGVQKVDSGPDKTELRYFRPSDEPEGQKLAQELEQLGAPVELKYVAGFESSTKIPGGAFELWLSPPEPHAAS